MAIEREFKVGTNINQYDQKPSVAVLDDGRFVVVWQRTNRLTDLGEIYGQKLLANGESDGTEFVVANSSRLNNSNPQVVSWRDEFIVAWQSQFADENNPTPPSMPSDSTTQTPSTTPLISDIQPEPNSISKSPMLQFRRFSPTTLVSSNDFLFVQQPGDKEYCAPTERSQPSIIIGPDTREELLILLSYIESHSKDNCDGSDFGLYTVFVDDRLTQRSIFLVHTYTLQEYSSMPRRTNYAATLLDPNNAVFATEIPAEDSNVWTIYVKRVHAISGVAREATRASSYTAGTQRNPAIARLTSTSFVVASESYEPDGTTRGVYVQKFSIDVSGNMLADGEELQVNIRPADAHTNPSIAALSNGDFVVIWNRIQNGTLPEVMGQKFFNNLTRLGFEFSVNIRSDSTQAHSIIVAADNGYGLSNATFIAAWDRANQNEATTAIHSRILLPRTLDIEHSVIPARNISSLVDGYLSNVNLAEYLALSSFASNATSQAWKAPSATLHPLIDYSLFPNEYHIVLKAALNEQLPRMELRVELYDQTQQTRNYTTVGRFNNIGSVKIATFADNSGIMAWSVLGAYGDNYNILLKPLLAQNSIAGDNIFVISYSDVGTFNLDRFPDYNSFIVSFVKDESNLVMQKFAVQNGRVVPLYRITKFLSKASPEFIVKTSPVDESFLLAWSYMYYHGIYAQRYDTSGAEAGDRINIRTSLNRFYADLNPEGSLLIAWQRDDVWQYSAQIFDSSGARVGQLVDANDVTNQVLVRAYFSDIGFVTGFATLDYDMKELAFVHDQSHERFLNLAASSSLTTTYLRTGETLAAANWGDLLLCGIFGCGRRNCCPSRSPPPRTPPISASPPPEDIPSSDCVELPILLPRLFDGLLNNNFICGNERQQLTSLTSVLSQILRLLLTEGRQGAEYDSASYAFCHNTSAEAQGNIERIYNSIATFSDSYFAVPRIEYSFTNDSRCLNPPRLSFSISVKSSYTNLQHQQNRSIQLVKVYLCPGYSALPLFPAMSSVRQKAIQASMSQYEVLVIEHAYALDIFNASGIPKSFQSLLFNITQPDSYLTNIIEFAKLVYPLCHRNAILCAVSYIYPECVGLYMNSAHLRDTVDPYTIQPLGLIYGLDNISMANSISSASNALHEAIINLNRSHLHYDNITSTAFSHLERIMEEGVFYQHNVACSSVEDIGDGCKYGFIVTFIEWLNYLSQGGCRSDAIKICGPLIPESVFPECFVNSTNSLYSTIARQLSYSALRYQNLYYQPISCSSAADSCQATEIVSGADTCVHKKTSCIIQSLDELYCSELYKSSTHTISINITEPSDEYALLSVEEVANVFSSNYSRNIAEFFPSNMTLGAIFGPRPAFYNTSNAASTMLSNGYRVLLRQREIIDPANTTKSKLTIQFYNAADMPAGPEHQVAIFPAVDSLAIGSFASEAIVIGCSIQIIQTSTYKILLQYIHILNNTARKILTLSNDNGAFAIAAFNTSNTFMVAYQSAASVLTMRKFSFDGDVILDHNSTTAFLADPPVMFDIKSAHDDSFKLFYSYLGLGIFIHRYTAQMQLASTSNIPPVKVLHAAFNPIIRTFKADFAMAGWGIVAWSQDMHDDGSEGLYIDLNYAQFIDIDGETIDTPFLLASGENVIVAKIDLTEVGYVAWLQSTRQPNCTFPLYYLHYNYRHSVYEHRAYEYGAPDSQSGLRAAINNRTKVFLWQEKTNDNSRNLFALTTKEQQTLQFVCGLNMTTIVNSSSAEISIIKANFLAGSTAGALSQAPTLCVLVDFVAAGPRNLTSTPSATASGIPTVTPSPFYSNETLSTTITSTPTRSSTLSRTRTKSLTGRTKTNSISPIKTRATLTRTPTAIEVGYSLVPRADVASLSSTSVTSAFFPSDVQTSSISRPVFYDLRNTDSAILANGYRALITCQKLDQAAAMTPVSVQLYNSTDAPSGSQLSIGAFANVHSVKIGGFGSTAIIVGWSISNPASGMYDIFLQRITSQGGSEKIIKLPSHDGAFAVGTLDNQKTFVVASRPEQSKLTLQRFSFDGTAASSYHNTNAGQGFTGPNVMFDLKAATDGTFKLLYSYLDSQGIFIQRYNTSDALGIYTLGDPLQIQAQVLGGGTSVPAIMEFKADFSTTGNGIVTWKQNVNPTQYIDLNFGQFINNNNTLYSSAYYDSPFPMPSAEYVVLSKIDFIEGPRYGLWLQLSILVNYTVPVSYLEYNRGNVVCNRSIYEASVADDEVWVDIVNNQTAVSLWVELSNNITNVKHLSTKEQAALVFVANMDIDSISNLTARSDSASCLALTSRFRLAEAESFSTGAIAPVEGILNAASDAVLTSSYATSTPSVAVSIPVSTGTLNSGTLGRFSRFQFSRWIRPKYFIPPAIGFGLLGPLLVLGGRSIGDPPQSPLSPGSGSSPAPSSAPALGSPPVKTVTPTPTNCISLGVPGYPNHYVCNANLTSNTMKSFAEIIMALDEDISTFRKIAGKVTFFGPNRALLCSSNELLDSLLTTKPLIDEVLELQNRYKNSTVYYHFIKGDDCRGNNYSYSQNYTWPSGSVYNIHLCNSFVNSVSFPTPGQNISDYGISQYQTIAREWSSSFNFYNAEIFNTKESNKKYTVAECQHVGDTCAPFNQHIIPADCFGIYMEIVHTLGDLSSINIAGIRLNATSFGINTIKLENIANEAFVILKNLSMATPTHYAPYWDIYNQYMCNNASTPWTVSWAVVQNRIQKMFYSVTNVTFSYVGICPHKTNMGGYSYNQTIAGVLCEKEGCNNLATVILCPEPLHKLYPTTPADPQYSFFSTIIHELTHAAYDSNDRTYEPEECEKWASRFCDPNISVDILDGDVPFNIAKCMQIFINSYYLSYVGELY